MEAVEPPRKSDDDGRRCRGFVGDARLNIQAWDGDSLKSWNTLTRAMRENLLGPEGW